MFSSCETRIKRNIIWPWPFPGTVVIMSLQVPDILSFNSSMISCPWQIALEFLNHMQLARWIQQTPGTYPTIMKGWLRVWGYVPEICWSFLRLEGWLFFVILDVVVSFFREMGVHQKEEKPKNYDIILPRSMLKSQHWTWERKHNWLSSRPFRGIYDLQWSHTTVFCIPAPRAWHLQKV